MSDSVRVGEHPRVQSFLKAYAASCEHNDVDPDDIAYFRTYCGQMFCVLIDRLEDLEREIEELK